MRNTMLPKIATALVTVVVLGAGTARAGDGIDRPSSAAPDATVITPQDQAEKDAHSKIERIAARFRNTIFLFDQSVTPDTLDRGSQLSAIPSYQWWFSLRPRYYFKPYLSLRTRIDLTLEWTNGGNDTTKVRQPLIGDLWTDLAYTPPTFGGVTATVSLRAVWGTSLDARADTSVVRLGPVVSLARAWQTKIGEFEPSLGLYTLYNFVQNTSAGANHSYRCASTDFTPTTCSQMTGLMNAQVSLVAALGLHYAPHPKVGIGLNYIILDSWAYHVPKTTLTDATGGTTVVTPQDDTRFRQSSWFLASVDYDALSWLSLSLGFYTLRSVRDPNGKIGNPFYQPGGHTRVFLTTTFTIDKIYESAAKRARKNRTNPMATIAPDLSNFLPQTF